MLNGMIGSLEVAALVCAGASLLEAGDAAVGVTIIVEIAARVSGPKKPVSGTPTELWYLRSARYVSTPKYVVSLPGAPGPFCAMTNP